MVADEIPAKDVPVEDYAPADNEVSNENGDSTQNVSTGDEVPAVGSVATGDEIPASDTSAEDRASAGVVISVESEPSGGDKPVSTISSGNQQVPSEKSQAGTGNGKGGGGGSRNSVVSKEVLEEWSDTAGHESEDKFFKILTDPKKFNLRKLEPGETPPADESIPNGTIFVGPMPREDDWNGRGILYCGSRHVTVLSRYRLI